MRRYQCRCCVDRFSHEALVYPSFSLPDEHDKPAVLLCSYTWSQDALRIGALITAASPVGEEELRDLMIKELGRLHAPSIIREEIAKAYVTQYGYGWSNDPYTSGAFALFGPGQFLSLYPYVIRPTAETGKESTAHLQMELVRVCPEHAALGPDADELNEYVVISPEYHCSAEIKA